MSSSVDICNRALLRIGAKGRISSLNEAGVNAVRCNGIYEPNRTSLLRQHFWNFAISLAQLAQLDDEPTFEYTYAYQLPSDCLRLIEVYNARSPYKIIGRQLHTDDSSCKIKYIKNITDSTQFDPLFEEALVLKLAVELSYVTNENATQVEGLKDEFKKLMNTAKQIDGMEDYPDQWPDGVWLDSRFGGDSTF